MTDLRELPNLAFGVTAAEATASKPCVDVRRDCAMSSRHMARSMS
jgi:hypothetical protein